MTVQCPRCGTQYRVADARLSEPRPVFKCTRCSHVFARGERSATKTSARDRDARNLSLPFAAAGEAASRPRDDHGDDDDAATDEDEDTAGDAEDALDRGLRAARGVDDDLEGDGEDDEAGRDTAIAFAGRAESKTRGKADPAFVADLARGRERPAARTEPARASDAPSRGARNAPPQRGRGKDIAADDADDDEGPLLISDPDRARRASVQPRGSRGAAGSGRSPFKPVAIGVASIIGVFLVAALVLRGRPELAFERLGAVPLLGRLIGGDHLLVWRLQFGGVESTVERIKGERSALVVSGHVVNTTNETLRIIEVEGLLLSDGVERMRKVVKAANQSRKTIRDLSSSEIDMLLRLEPNRRFAVRPGESVNFLIVFPDPPASATEITCRIVDARAA